MSSPGCGVSRKHDRAARSAPENPDHGNKLALPAVLGYGSATLADDFVRLGCIGSRLVRHFEPEERE
jgi:hypothetical protein